MTLSLLQTTVCPWNCHLPHPPRGEHRSIEPDNPKTPHVHGRHALQFRLSWHYPSPLPSSQNWASPVLWSPLLINPQIMVKRSFQVQPQHFLRIWLWARHRRRWPLCLLVWNRHKNCHPVLSWRSVLKEKEMRKASALISTHTHAHACAHVRTHIETQTCTHTRTHTHTPWMGVTGLRPQVYSEIPIIYLPFFSSMSHLRTGLCWDRCRVSTEYLSPLLLLLLFPVLLCVLGHTLLGQTHSFALRCEWPRAGGLWMDRQKAQRWHF